MVCCHAVLCSETSLIPCDWNVELDGCKFFRKARQWRKGGDVPLYINDHLESMDLHLETDVELTTYGLGLKGNG